MAKCDAWICGNPATHVYTWRSLGMPAPAFWYGCEECAKRWKEEESGGVESTVKPISN